MLLYNTHSHEYSPSKLHTCTQVLALKVGEHILHTCVHNSVGLPLASLRGLSHGHNRRIFWWECVKRGIWLDTDPIVVVF